MEEVRAEREKKRSKKDPDYEALCEFVARTMRERGNDASRALFMPQLYSVLGFLGAMKVNRLGENDELILQAIIVHESLGDEGLHELYNNISASDEETSEKVMIDESAE